MNNIFSFIFICFSLLQRKGLNSETSWGMRDSIGSWATSSLAHCLNAVSTGTYVSHSFLFWTLGLWDEIISFGVCYVFCPKNIKKGAVWVVLGVFSFFVNCINLVSLLVECHKLFSHCNNLLQIPLKKKAWIKKFASSNIWILVFFFFCCTCHWNLLGDP